jgi:predicted MFS family arabinose efflux permease
VIPERCRSPGSAVINSGMAFRISLGFIDSSFVATDLDLGWRASFLIFSIPTTMVAIAIWLFVRDRTSMAEEREEFSEGGASIKELLTDKTLLMIYATIFCSLYGFFVILTWLRLCTKSRG